MQLYFAHTSPFARKVRIAAHELGLADALRLIEVDPWTDAALRRLNPLAKVPTLVTEDGLVLFESPVLVAYLAARAGRSLLPEDEPGRWATLTAQGVADGAMTAAGRLFADERKPPDQRSAAVMARQAEALAASLDWLDSRTFATDPTVAEIGAAALCGYLDFRWPDRDWRAARSRLAGWFDTFAARPSMAATPHP